MGDIYLNGNPVRAFVGGSKAIMRLGTDVENSDNWESFATLQSLIDNTAANGT